MSVTSKSPLDFLVTAWAVAKRALPACRQMNSPKKFTQHQLKSNLSVLSIVNWGSKQESQANDTECISTSAFVTKDEPS